MTKSFVKAETANFGTLYFSPCGKLFFATSEMGEFETSSMTPAGGVLKCRWSYCGVLVKADARVKVTSITECECNYKRAAIEVAEELGGFKYGKKVFRTFSSVTSECSECEQASKRASEQASECNLDEELIGLA